MRDTNKEQELKDAYAENVRQGIKSVVAEIIAEILPLGREWNADSRIITRESMAKNKPK